MELIERISTVETHTEGEPTRIVIAGLPFIKKNSMIEIKEEIIKKYDYIRTMLMHEPRGYIGMFGAIITPPIDEDCDYGVVFMDSGSYCNMCGHGSIGVAKYAIESGLVKKTYPVTKIKSNTPAGKVKLEVKFNEKKAIESIALINVKSFNYMSDLKVKIFNKTIIMDIAFGGNFFGIIDADAIDLKISPDNIIEVIKIGTALIAYLKDNVKIQHPLIKNIASVDLIQFNTRKDLNGSHNKSIVIFGKGQYDRSPCGTGTSALLANLYYHDKLRINDEFINESIISTKFICKILKEDNSDGINGIIPQIKGNAFIISYADYVIENGDPLGKGFLIS